MTAAPDGPVASATRSACAWIVGAVVSRTWTSNMEVAVLPAASWALHVTVAWPSANSVPEAGAQVTGTAPSCESLAVGRV